MNTEDSECNHTLTIQNISRHLHTEVHAALLDILQGVTRTNTAAQQPPPWSQYQTTITMMDD